MGQEAGWSDEELNQMVLHEVSNNTHPPPPPPIRESREQSEGYFLESPKIISLWLICLSGLHFRIPMDQISKNVVFNGV